MAPFRSLRDRPTADLIVLFLAALVGLYVIGSMTFIAVTSLTDTGNDAASLLINRLGSIVNSIVGAVIGFVGGRGVGSNEGFERGLHFPDPPTKREDDPDA